MILGMRWSSENALNAVLIFIKLVRMLIWYITTISL